MKVLLLMFTTLLFSSQPISIYQFDKNAKISDWQIVNDGVMGGKSSSTFVINHDGNGEFKGKVSLDNYGGFASVRLNTSKIDCSNKSKVKIELKGDGKRYQFRLKSSNRDFHSYINYFETSSKWEIIEIDLKDLFPSFRGRILNMPNFDAESIEELAFLIANKKAEDFCLEIKSIELI